MSTAKTFGKTQLGLIESAGNLCQSLGVPRSTGQIYGLLYLSSKPLSLDDIAGQLSISKASASGGSRQLIGWQAIRQVWIPGDRRDFFEARDDLAEVIRAVYKNVVRTKLEKSNQTLDEFFANLEEESASGGFEKEEYDRCKAKLQRISSIQNRLNLLLPLVDKILS